MTEEGLKARVADVEADNARLRRLLDAGDAPGELRHRLRGTLALLRSIIRQSADKASDLEGYVAHLLDRLDAITRAQAAADTYGHVDLHSLLANQLLHYRVSEDGRLRLAGPAVQLSARPAQMLALAIHELAVNAIEHGALGVDNGTLDIFWELTELGEFIFVWKESGVDRPEPSTRQGFGTQMLLEMLQYEFSAKTTLDWEADGLRCTIRFAWSDKIGSVIEEKAVVTQLL